MSTTWGTLYNLEVVIALAFRLNTYEASRIRQKVLESYANEMRTELTCLYHWVVIVQLAITEYDSRYSTATLYVLILQGRLYFVSVSQKISELPIRNVDNI